VRASTGPSRCFTTFAKTAGVISRSGAEATRRWMIGGRGCSAGHRPRRRPSTGGAHPTGQHTRCRNDRYANARRSQGEQSVWWLGRMDRAPCSYHRVREFGGSVAV
jgi:hypothetical protein